MLSLKSLIVSVCVAGSVAGCAAHPLESPMAMSIIVSNQAPTAQCDFLGEVNGSQGGFLEGPFTRDEDLVLGARNMLRDRAYGLGANYVAIELEHLSHNAGDGGTGGGYSAIIVGNAYKC